MTLAIVGAVFLVGSTLSSMRRDILRSLASVASELRDVEDKLETIKVGAKHGVQEFVSIDFVAEHKGYKIFYENRHYYIRGVNARFFTKAGAENWIDRTEVRRKNLMVCNFWVLADFPNQYMALPCRRAERLNGKKDTDTLRFGGCVTPKLWAPKGRLH